MLPPSSSSDFLNQVTELIRQNMVNEQFGVSELADALHMSRSNLLRKVKKESKLSVSQLINQVRLKEAMQLLRQSSLNVSEVSHQVGFGSTSYFIKCFREYYGYPPGEVGKRPETEPLPVVPSSDRKYALTFIVSALLLAAMLSLLYVFHVWPFAQAVKLDKSIVVLPFKNESSDSTNLYFVNGLMESTLNNLQKIKDLRVISRTSSEKYRDTRKSIPEMAKELNVSYFVEGSGQKVGNKILLSIQLIEAATDKHIWSRQYQRETQDIFQLQQEVAKSIAEEIQAIITPEEQQRIAKRPTQNLAAYDLYLKGKEFQSKGGGENLWKAVGFFKQAVAEDEGFASAYAEIALTTYYYNFFRSDKQRESDISIYADKALLYDSKLGESLMAKAIDYINRKEYAQAEPYLEKALEYNPNSASVIGALSDFYTHYIPNTSKYLTYALKGIRLDIAAQDSVTASYTYLRLANALIQTGFVDESLKYIDKSLAYNSKNPFARYIRAFILYAKTKDLDHTRELLIQEYKQDSSRFDILQDIGKVSIYLRDYDGAYRYYKQFLTIRESQKLDVFRHENMNIGFAMEKAGEKQKAEELIESYKGFLDADQSIYKSLGYVGYYHYKGDDVKALEYLKQFAKEDNVQYWIILFIESDPMTESTMKTPEFANYVQEIKDRFWRTHNQLKSVLAEEGLLE
jgi:TolB-like protein/AraC-like DNA-binding protein/Tfp pilus assembly protein PilF